MILYLCATIAAPPILVLVAGQPLPDTDQKHAVPPTFVANDKAREVHKAIVCVFDVFVISTLRHKSIHLVTEEERCSPDEKDDVTENCRNNTVPVLVTALRLWVEDDPQSDDVFVPLEHCPEHSDYESLRKLLPQEIDGIFQHDVQERHCGHVDHVAEDLNVWIAIVAAPTLHLFTTSLSLLGLSYGLALFDHILSRIVILRR